MRIKNYLNMIVVVLMILLWIAPVARADGEGDPLERGNQAYRRGQYELAIYEYTQVLTSFDNRHAEASYNIGVCHLELGRKSEAIKWFRVAIKAKAGRYPNASYALGIALEEMGRWGEAKEAFNKAVESSKGRHAPALFKMGLALQREGDYEGAAASYHRAIANSRDRIPACHNNLGVVLAGLGRLADAEREFYIALKQSNGDFSEARYNLERCRLLRASQPGVMIAGLKTSDNITGAQPF